MAGIFDPQYSEYDMQRIQDKHNEEIRSIRTHYERELSKYRPPFFYTGDRINFPFIYSSKEVSLPVATKHHILISSDGAATHPVQHSTLSSAETEATRIAKKFPGQEITVYTAVKSFKVEEKPVTVKTFI